MAVAVQTQCDLQAAFRRDALSGLLSTETRFQARARLEGHAGLQRALHGEELVANLLAVQVLDDILCVAHIHQLAEGVALRMAASVSACL